MPVSNGELPAKPPWPDPATTYRKIIIAHHQQVTAHHISQENQRKNSRAAPSQHTSQRFSTSVPQEELHTTQYHKQTQHLHPRLKITRKQRNGTLQAKLKPDLEHSFIPPFQPPSIQLPPPTKFTSHTTNLSKPHPNALAHMSQCSQEQCSDEAPTDLHELVQQMKAVLRNNNNEKEMRKYNKDVLPFLRLRFGKKWKAKVDPTPQAHDPVISTEEQGRYETEFLVCRHKEVMQQMLEQATLLKLQQSEEKTGIREIGEDTTKVLTSERKISAGEQHVQRLHSRWKITRDGKRRAGYIQHVKRLHSRWKGMVYHLETQWFKKKEQIGDYMTRKITAYFSTQDKPPDTRTLLIYSVEQRKFYCVV